MLLRPLGLLFQINTGRVDFSSLISAVCPVVILAVNLRRLGRDIPPQCFCLYLLLCLMGLGILSAFMVCLYAFAFSFVRVDGLNNIYYMLMNISEKPQELFGRCIFYVCFLFAVPANPIANIPARVLLGRMGYEGVLASAVSLGLFLLGVRAAVSAGLKRYAEGGG